MMDILKNFYFTKKNILNKDNFIFLLFISIIFFFDRISKLKILDDFSDTTYFVNNYINFDLTWNTGIGFGLLSSSSNFFYNSLTILIALIILVLFYISLLSIKVEKYILSLIIGGAIGNFYDRITFKSVPDFIDIHYNNFHWFTFNIADIFITLGVLSFMIKSIFDKN